MTEEEKKAIEYIKRRINILEIAKKQKIKEVEITKEEAMQIPENIKNINGVKLIIVDELGDKSKKDCFAYLSGECYALNKLYCKREKCNFYRNDIKIPKIETDIKKYTMK